MPSNRRKPDVVTSFPNYDLHRAAAAGNLGLVQYALTQGQPVNSVLAGVLPIHAAASGGFEPVVRMLLDAGADVNAPRLSSKMGPRSDVGGIASVVGPSSGRSSSAQGPRPGSSGTSSCPTSPAAPTIGNRGSTPLHFAAAMGHVSIVKLLLERGADPNLRDANKLRPIDEAKTQGRQKIVQLLEAWETIKAFPLTDRPATTPTLTHQSTPWSDNGSTTSLPVLPSATANGSTSSLGRHSVAARRPSLPSIKETSPPSTSPQAICPKPKTSVSEPRRPKSAGSGTSGASNERQWSSPTSRGAGIQPSTQAISLTKIFKKTPFRPSSASAAESQFNPSASHPSRQPFISKIVEKTHCHEPHQGITVDVISGPLSGSQGPSHSIQEDVRPDIGQISAVELHYATQNAFIPDDCARVPQTAPPTQASFAVPTRVTDSRGRSPSRPDTNPGLTVPRHRMGLIGMHGADPHQLGPEGPRSRIDSEATLLSTTSGSSGINTDEYQVEQRDRSPHPKGNSHLSPYSARSRQVSGNGSERSPNRPRGESLSSMVSDATSNSNATSKDSELSSVVRTPHSAALPDSVVNKEGVESASLSTNETRKANSPIMQEDAEDLRLPAIDSPTKQKRRSKRPGSSPVSPISAPPQSPLVGLGISANDFLTDIRLTTHAEVREMRVAQMRAIEEVHEKETTRRRAASASADQPPGMTPIEETLDTDPTILRQHLAALGQILQLERRFAIGEKQGNHWNKPREEDGSSESGHPHGGESMSAYSAPLSVKIRNDQLYKALDPDLEEDRTRKPIATKRDVFGQPITKEKERRPSTPKDARPSTAPKTTTQPATRVVDAPRENRILPPAEKTVRIANPSMLTPPHVPHRARSEHSLPQVNRDEIAGRDRAWTTTDVRPRLGPVASNPKLTIELATPTDRSDPLWPPSDVALDQRKEGRILEEQSESPTMVSVLEAAGKGYEEQETRTTRKPLKIRRPRTAPMTSTTPVDTLATESPSPFTSDSKIVSAPTISHAEPPPSAAPSPPQKDNPPSSFYQTITPLATGSIGAPLTRIVTEPFDKHRTPVELHNLLAVQSRDERRTGSGDSPNWKNHKESTMPRAVEKRLGIGAGGQASGFGLESVRSLEAEKPFNPFHIPIPGDELASQEPSKSKGPKKIVGFFSRLKK